MKKKTPQKKKNGIAAAAENILDTFNPRTKRESLATNWKFLSILIVLAVFPLLNPNPYHIDTMVNAGIFMLLAMGLHVMVGCAGILNLGYAALFAFGAYTYGLINIHLNVSFWPGLLISGFATAIFGTLLALPALRLSGDYLAIVTLGAGEIARISLNNLDPITGGPNGLLGIAHPVIPWIHYDFGVRSEPYYFLLLLMVAGILLGMKRLETSRLGRAWMAIREDELAASFMGVNPLWAKLTAFGIGGFVAGLAGCVFAAKQGTVSPDSFDFIVSVMVVAMVVLGGIGNVYGALLGAFILSLLPEFLRGFETYRMLLFGLAMIIIMLVRPQGILPASRCPAVIEKKSGKKSKP